MAAKNEIINWQEIKEKMQQVAHFFNKPLDPERIKGIYQERALQLARRQVQVSQQIADIPILVFSLRQNPYGIELEYLLEILPFKNCTPVPHAHHTIKGIINLRSEIRCVMDLAQIMESEQQEHQENHDSTNNNGYILMVKKNQVGLKIDKIQRILLIQKKELHQVTREKSMSRNEYSKGIIPGNIILLDVDKILSHPVFISAVHTPGQ